jgi:hypothetical protein
MDCSIMVFDGERIGATCDSLEHFANFSQGMASLLDAAAEFSEASQKSNATFLPHESRYLEPRGIDYRSG